MDASSKAVFELSHGLLTQILKTNKDKNICYSPVSIAILLKMVMSGAGGNTKAEIAKVLLGSQECSSSKQGCSKEEESSVKELLSSIKDKKFELIIANAVFADKEFPVEEQFVHTMINDFNAEVKNSDFKNKADAERENINKWVKDKTKGKIDDLYEKGTITNSTVAALVNAIYFKGIWASKFDEKNTKEGTFYVNKNEKKTVQMMFKSGKFNYAEVPEAKCKVLALPYQDNISMLVVLPDDVDGLQKVLSMATCDLITNIMQKKQLAETEIDLMMPKFKIEERYELAPFLKSLGITEVFQPNADLSGISKIKGLYVSTLVHKSFVLVNEEGTEAAAATGGGISVTSLPIRKSFNVDHPCLFFLITSAKLILFTGMLVSP